MNDSTLGAAWLNLRSARWAQSLLALMLLSLLTAAADTAAEFSYPQPGRQFTFPRDFGSHPDFKIEWWYITGHLFADGGRRFGFQATFFRQAGSTPGHAEEEEARLFAGAPFFLAHMSLLDVKNGKFIYQERLNRSGWDAHASTRKLDVQNGNWSLRMNESGTMSLVGGVRGEALFQLELSPEKPLVIFGKDNVSRKGSDPHASSYYLTYPRLKVEGTLKQAEKSLNVTGMAWMDHEISSSQLTRDQVGWDWASIQLNDGREIMAYRMRLADGSVDPYSTLAWIDKAGAPHHLAPNEWSWKTLATWQSPRNQAKYPSSVEIIVPDENSRQPLQLRLVPLYADQELSGALGGVAYWEGACRVLDKDNKEVGSAYLELTGYAARLKGVQ